MKHIVRLSSTLTFRLMAMPTPDLRNSATLGYANSIKDDRSKPRAEQFRNPLYDRALNGQVSTPIVTDSMYAPGAQGVSEAKESV